MLLSLKRLFRRAVMRPPFYSDCDKSERALWHSLADASDYLESLSPNEKEEKMSLLFNKLASDHGWQLDGEENKLRLWVSGMLGLCHKTSPDKYFLKHSNFLRRYNEEGVKIETDAPETNKTARDFLLDKHLDIRVCIKSFM